VQQLHEEVPSFVPGSSEHELRAQLQDHERAVLAAWGDWKCLLPVQRPLLDGLLAPSAWARAVLQSSFPQHRIICAPHGVNPEVHRPSPGTHEQNCKDFEAGQFRVLHFTSTLGQRKGTRELLLAWRRWARAEGGHRAAKMLVFANPLAVNELMRQVHELGIADSVGVSAVTSASGHDMAATIRYAHLICQPSRGEGFGLVPLEARACGVPVLATACTGHSEHMSPGTPGVIAVSHGDLESIDDYPGALAPSVSPSDIWAALETAHARWGSFAEEAQAAADEVRREWSWENKNKQVLAELVDEAG
jgi:glycosyltransferase involved in cell wall biosynthesis